MGSPEPKGSPYGRTIITMTTSVNRKGRMRLKKVAEQLTYYTPQSDSLKKLGKKECRSVAKGLRAMADYWEANPTRWTRGSWISGTNEENWKFCNAGLLQAALGQFDQVQNQPKLGLTKPTISTTLAYFGFAIQLNDGSSSLAENVEGLRLIANAYELYAEATGECHDAWKASVEKAFRKNSKLLQVQMQRYKAKRQAARDAARAAAKELVNA